MSDTKASWLSAPVAILLGAALIAGSVLYIGKSPSDGTANVLQPGDQQIATIEDYESLVTESDPVLGNPDAPVTIVEFSDFQCPYCRSFWLSTYPQLKKDYIDTGKVKLVYRNFPLPFHSAAMPSAIGGQCAEDQGKFWEYHDELFAQQMKLEADPTRVAVTIPYAEPEIKAWARSAGLDGAAFDACLDAKTYEASVQEDIAAADAATVEANIQNEWGTPGFFVNGFPVVGAQPFAAFQQAIEAAL